MPRKTKEYKVNVYDEELETYEEKLEKYEKLKEWIYKFLFTGEYRVRETDKESSTRR
ncbi:hypothetical protein [Priestia koreensis]|uniref:hypothetical protein n=1 Tax=Priestia koreensis TaxID=284581 RepID=UPI000B20EC74|nr:hypothetical protein [Priestia koreensis]